MPHIVGSRSRLWSGLTLIALGILFLLDRFGYLHFGEFAETWWPSLLILIGVVRLVRRRFWRSGGALFLIMLGVVLQVGQLDLFPWWTVDRLWPVLLILLGLWLLVGRLGAVWWQPAAAPARRSVEVIEESGETIDAFMIWGGLERAVTSKDFRGGNATAIMAGIELDLRGAALAPGDQTLHLTAIMGGISVRVPPDWQVVLEATPILGAVEDKRGAASAAAAADSGAAGRLRLQGAAIMGGIELKS